MELLDRFDQLQLKYAKVTGIEMRKRKRTYCPFPLGVNMTMSAVKQFK
jgi:hypothetical protein